VRILSWRYRGRKGGESSATILTKGRGREGGGCPLRELLLTLGPRAKKEKKNERESPLYRLREGRGRSEETIG